MSRRNRAEVREVVSDPVYGSKVVTKVINQVMLDGKRSIAQKVVYDAMAKAGQKLNAEPLDVFNKSAAPLFPQSSAPETRFALQNHTSKFFNLSSSVIVCSHNR